MNRKLFNKEGKSEFLQFGFTSQICTFVEVMPECKLRFL